ncbi:ABC transporter permease [Thermaerobacter subterraneus]|uniref:ABC-type dipeptide/oligopeptide/nickel transport system, permease component n=1 Tax=Thermaerobacter subterraneus DSM 13965 TaxID=867903 RepID=K6P0D0_9FIRM|nr:ABC transporter permease [Thermaerobacter subterraneus]EKP94540.1 ABC-type dipeptide/oligopeptide/nickel transport system, permease component [Thermaerobacter subterraneus DSM 13965]
MAVNRAARPASATGPDLTPDLFQPAPMAAGEAEAIVRPSLTFWQDAWIRFRANRLAMLGMVLLIFMALGSLLGPVISYHVGGHTFDFQDYANINKPPSAQYWFGTDQIGRDLFTRVWMGGRISLFIGIVAALLELIIGVLYGGISGYLGGRVDEIMMRIIDVLYGIPYLLLVILLLVVMNPGLPTIILAMGLTGWVGMARLVRGQILQLREMEFVLAARVLGVPTLPLILRHLVPNVMGPIIVSLTLTVPGAIFGEAFLSFIGLGVPPPRASWGTLINEAYTVMRIWPWQFAFPALALSITMFAFNAVGDGLRDALDPRLRAR